MKLEYKFTAKDIIAEGRTTEEYIEAIRTWVSSLEDTLVPSSIQDELLVLFLLSCNNDIQLTKKTILSYYKCKKEGPEIHDNRIITSPELQRAFNTFHFSVISERTDDNYAIFYCNIHDANYNNFGFIEMLKIAYMMLDIAQEENPPNGLIVFLDLKGFSLMHMTKFKLGALKKFFQFLQEGCTIQIKAAHIINSVYFIDRILTIVKIFVKSEIIDMIKIYPPGLTQEEICKIIPKKCVPEDYGGDLPSEKELHEITMRQFKEKQEFWDIEEKIRKKCWNT